MVLSDGEGEIGSLVFHFAQRVVWWWVTLRCDGFDQRYGVYFLVDNCEKFNL